MFTKIHVSVHKYGSRTKSGAKNEEQTVQVKGPGILKNPLHCLTCMTMQTHCFVAVI